MRTAQVTTRDKMLQNMRSRGRRCCNLPYWTPMVVILTLLFADHTTLAFQSPVARYRSSRVDVGCTAVQLSARRRRTGRFFSSTSSSSLHLSASIILGSTGDYSFPEDDFDEDQPATPEQLLSYLPEQDFPPQTSNLLKRVTENYVYGTDRQPVVIAQTSNLLERVTENNVRQPVTMAQVLAVINAEYKSRDVPMKISNEIFDVCRTGEDPDESVVEVLSFAALHRLPEEITLELLGSKHDQDESSFSTCQAAFARGGWAQVTFPKGLALRTKRMYASASEKQTHPWLPSMKKLAAMAQQAVDSAKSVKAPRRQLQTRSEFLQSMEAQLSATAAPTSPNPARKDDLLFFPNSQPLQGISFKRVKRAADKKYAMLKAKGRSGFIAYVFFNFLFYTVGVLWQWQRIAAAHPTSQSSALLLLSRKFARTFAALYVGSQFFKLPKLFGSVALAPVADRVLKFTMNKLNISENRACIVLVASMYLTWMGLVSIPVLSEFTKLKRLIRLDTVVDVYEAQPALLLRYATTFAPTIITV
jgi:hypothetical protein